jgi:hypothetical protein
MHHMVIYNAYAFVSIIGGLVIGAAAASLGLPPTGAGICGLLTAAAIDIYMRCKSEEVVQNNLWHPNAGGHIWFIPVWICSAVGLIGTIGSAMGLIQ